MPIDVKETSLDEIKVEGTTYDDTVEVIYDKELPESEYVAVLARVYPWRSVTKNTKVSLRDESGRYIKDDKGNRVKEEVKDLTWFNADVVLAVKEGVHAGKAIKASLSTHPDMMGQLKSFLYCTGLFGVVAADINKHIGAEVGVVTRNIERSWTDQNTGLERTVAESKASYFKKPSEITNTEEDFGV